MRYLEVFLHVYPGFPYVVEFSQFWSQLAKPRGFTPGPKLSSVEIKKQIGFGDNMREKTHLLNKKNVLKRLWFRVETNGKAVKPVTLAYKPGRDRERPYHLELVLTLPPK
jgi:hypothetical protein